MKKLLISCVLMTVPALAQSVRWDSNITTSASNVPLNASAPVLTVPNSIVTICGFPAVGTPCTNTVPIFFDQALTQPLDNPLRTDAKGRFGFWITPAQYSYSVQNQNGVNLGNFPLSLNSPAGPPGPSGSATQAGFISAAAYLNTTGTFAQMMADATTANSTITISAVTPLPNGTTTVSSDRNLLGLGGGNFTCPSGTCTLAFSGGNFDAPSRTVFGSNVVVTGLKVAKPEWWGGANPFISKAINALAAAGGKILLADQSLVVYRSGYDTLSNVVMTKNNIEIAGTGICTPLDDLSTCTGGSRIMGQFDNSASYLNYHDFGVDDGCLATATLYSGNPGDGLVLANPGQLLTFRQKTVNLERVSGLVCGKSAAFHAVLMENIDGLHANTIYAYGGIHGAVIKTLNSEITGVVSKHHDDNCFYNKSDNYAPSRSSSLQGLVASDCGRGLLVQAVAADLLGFTANGINCDSTVTQCLFITGTGGFTTSGIVISDVASYAATPLFTDATVSDLQITNITSNNQQSSLVINNGNTTLRGFQLLNVPVSVAPVVVTTLASNAILSDGIISGTGTSSSPINVIATGATTTNISNIQIKGAWTGFCIGNIATGQVSISALLVPGSCALGVLSGSLTMANGQFTTQVVSSGSTSNVVTIPGNVAPYGCQFSAVDSAAAADAASDYLDTIVLHSFTLHHSTTPGMTFRATCNF